jgi:uncharacterized glyoxalase superfamily protein PhnB
MSITFDGFVVFASDFAASAAVYENDLGLARAGSDDDHIAFQLPTKGDPKGAWLLLHPVTDGREPPQTLGSFTVDDVDALVERLRAAGHRITEEPHDEPWGVRQAGVADPDGYGLVLTAPLA